MSDDGPERQESVAYYAGYRAFSPGMPRPECPYQDIGEQLDWERGWGNARGNYEIHGGASMSGIPSGPEGMAIISSALIALTERVETVAAGQSAIRVEFLAALVKTRGDVMARLDGVGDQLSAICNDITVNFGTADQVRRANDNTRDELVALVDQVAGMMRQILRLQTELKGQP